VDNTASKPLLVSRYDQGETFRDTQGALDFESRSGIGNIANGAIDDAAAELNFGSLQDAVTRSNSLFHTSVTGPVSWSSEQAKRMMGNDKLNRICYVPKWTQAA